MRSLLVIAALIVACYNSVFACIDPLSVFYSGVVFDNEEDVDFSKIEISGEPYIKECYLQSSSSDAPVFIYEGGLPELLPSDPVQIQFASVEANTLTLIVEYSGGCQEHDFTLVTNGLIQESMPPQIPLVLTHYGNEDACDGIVTDTLVFDLSRLCSIGDYQSVEVRLSDVNFTVLYQNLSWAPVRTGAQQMCSYKIRSALSENVMTYLGYFSISYQNDSTLPRIAVMFDTSSIPSGQQLADAVKAELERLRDLDIISLTDQKIAQIHDSLIQSSGQYWTKEDKVLPYNMWIGGGVRGPVTAKMCGLGVAFNLPDIVSSSQEAAVKSRHDQNRGELLATHECGMICFRFPAVTSESAFLQIFNMNARQVATIQLSKNMSQIHWNQKSSLGTTLPAGCYIAKVTDGTRVSSKRVSLLRNLY